MPRLLIVLPAYNEEESLPPLISGFQHLFHKLPKRVNPLIIVVNDGSQDGTADVVMNARKLGYPIELVDHPRNKGLGEAIKTGLRRAVEISESDDDVLVYMDADNTHPPRFVIPMIKKMYGERADIVIASRYRRGSRQYGVPLFRQAMSLGALLLFFLFLRLKSVRDYTCGYRAYRMGLIRRALQEYGDEIITRSGFACTDQLLVNLACIGARIREVPFVLRYDRKHGKSKIELGTTIIETFHLLFDARRRLKSSPKARRLSMR